MSYRSNSFSSLRLLLIPNVFSITFFAILLAEALLFLKQFWLGLLVHVVNLIFIIGSVILAAYLLKIKERVDRSSLDYLQVIMLIPLLRILNVSMPVFFSLTVYWFPLIYAPMFIPIFIVSRSLGFTGEQLGINSRKIALFIPLGLLIGAVIGVIESLILSPAYLIPDLSWGNVLLLAIVMFFFVGLVEELVFRSIVQTRLEQLFGLNGGLLVAGLLFGVMHSGYSMFLEVVFAFSAGIFIGYLFQRTRSLLFITVIHGAINVFLFGIIPLLTL